MRLAKLKDGKGFRYLNPAQVTSIGSQDSISTTTIGLSCGNTTTVGCPIAEVAAEINAAMAESAADRDAAAEARQEGYAEGEACINQQYDALEARLLAALEAIREAGMVASDVVASAPGRHALLKNVADALFVVISDPENVALLAKGQG